MILICLKARKKKYESEQAYYVIQKPYGTLSPDTCSTQTEQGKYNYPDGSKQIEAGRYVLADGTLKTLTPAILDERKNPGDKKLPKEDCIKCYDGTVILPSEAILRRDGKLRTLDGKITEPTWLCKRAPFPVGASQDPDDYSFWINELSIIEPPDSDVGMAFGILNLRMYRQGPDVSICIVEARGLSLKKKHHPVFVQIQLSTGVDASLKPKNKDCFSLSVKDIATRSLYKKSALSETVAIKVPHSPSSPDRNQSSVSMSHAPSVSSLAIPTREPSLGPFKTKGQKVDKKDGAFRFGDYINLRLASSSKNKYEFKDTCLTVSLWEKFKTKNEIVGVIFVDSDQIPTSKGAAGDTWLCVQAPPPN